MDAFGKRYPLTRANFADFEKAFGEDPRKFLLKVRKSGAS